MIKLMTFLKTVDYEYLLNQIKKVNSEIVDSEKVYGLLLDTRKIDLDEYPDLKFIARDGVGIDNIDIEECQKRNIKIITTPCIELSSSVAEFAIMQTMLFLRIYPPPVILTNRRFGIIGYGRIGFRIRSFCNIFTLQDIFTDRKNHIFIYDKDLGSHDFHKDNLLKFSDIIFVCISGNEEVIGDEDIKKMEACPVIVNIARAGCVNTNSVFEAIKRREVAGYISDVDDYDQVPKELKNKVLYSPHVASDTFETRSKMEELLFSETINFIRKEL